MASSLRCYECGRLFTEVSQFMQVEQAGLALVGRCPGCNARQHIGALWGNKGKQVAHLVTDYGRGKK